MQRPVGRPAILTGLSCALLFGLNLLVAGKLASIEYLDAMQSIEGAYIAISRFAMHNWGDLTWFPLWYAGIPFQNAYPPLLHLLVAGVAWFLGITPALSYHFVNTVLYCLGPVALFWLAWRWSGSRICGFGAGLLYSLISPSAFLISNVRIDLGSLLHIRRLQTVVFYGDGPFVCSLAMVPAALALLDLALAKRRPLFYLLAAMGLAAVVLTNWLGGATLAFAVVAYLLSRREPRRDWPVAAGIGALAYALASPLLPPSTIKTIQFNAQTVGADYHMGWRQALYGLVAVVALLGLRCLLDKTGASTHLKAALYFAFLTCTITLSAEWGGIYIVPQPHRYHMAMDVALCLTVAFLLEPLWSRAPAWGRKVAAVIILVAAVAQAYHLHLYADGQIRPIDIRKTTEYRTALWFDRNMQGRRVMAPAAAFFLNAFTSTPQLGGGFELGTPNWTNRIALYAARSGDGEMSTLWLKAFGVRAAAVGGPLSGAHYKGFDDPHKFVGLLPEAWRDGDDYIYYVPARSDSLAHVVRSGDLVVRPPINGLDLAEVRRYVAALEDPDLPLAEMHWTSRHSARITAPLQSGQLVSVQVTYHPGWRAEVNGSRRPVRADGIGLMAIDPQCGGPCTVDLIYDGGTEMRIARAASVAGFLGCLGWSAFAWVRRRRSVYV